MSDTNANLRDALAEIAEDIAEERHHRTLAADYGPIDAGAYADRMLDAVRKALLSHDAVAACRDTARGIHPLDLSIDRAKAGITAALNAVIGERGIT